MVDLSTFDKIYVLVSGGIDSTYLYEKLKGFYRDKVYPVNCFSPYEQSKTLDQISQDPNFILIEPDKKYNYGKILKNAFLKLPEARKLKREGKYHKKVFPCCYYIKHKAFMNNSIFKEDNTVIISGIKHGDGSQRAAFLSQLRNGSKRISNSKKPNNYYFLTEGKAKPTFLHKHRGGQVYCYPFRDYYWNELPSICIRRLKKKYPNLKHSGCEICPVLVLFNISEEEGRYKKSIEYAKKLGVYNDIFY